MTTKAAKLNKFVAIALLLAILGGEVALGFAASQPAFAQSLGNGSPVYQVGQNGTTFTCVKVVNGVNVPIPCNQATVIDTPRTIRELVLNVIAKNTVMAVQAIFLRSLTDWVRNGMNGKPQFVTNPEQYFKQLAGAAILNSQIQLLSTRMCKPFGNGSSGGVTINVPSLGGYPELTCTLSNPNIQGFYDKFENGGWQTWRELAQPQNNAFGMFSLVGEASSREVSNSYAHGNREVIASQGFLGIKNCAVNVAFSAAVLGKQFGSNQCAQYANITPGGIVASKVAKQLNQLEDHWVNVHEISDLIAAFINTALNKLIGTRFFCLDCAGAVAASGLTVGLGGALNLECVAQQGTGGVTWVKAGDTVRFIASANAKQTTPPLTFTFVSSPISPNIIEPTTITVGGVVADINLPTKASDAGKTLVIDVSAKDSSKPTQAGTAQCTVQVKGAMGYQCTSISASSCFADQNACDQACSSSGQRCNGPLACTPPATLTCSQAGCSAGTQTLCDNGSTKFCVQNGKCTCATCTPC